MARLAIIATGDNTNKRNTTTGSNFIRLRVELHGKQVAVYRFIPSGDGTSIAVLDETRKDARRNLDARHTIKKVLCAFLRIITTHFS